MSTSPSDRYPNGSGSVTHALLPCCKCSTLSSTVLLLEWTFAPGAYSIDSGMAGLNATNVCHGSAHGYYGMTRPGTYMSEAPTRRGRVQIAARTGK